MFQVFQAIAEFVREQKIEMLVNFSVIYHVL